MLKTDLRTTAILTLASIIGSLSVMPAIFAARAHTAAAAATPAWEVYATAIVQSVILFGITAFLGLRAARGAGLPGAPLVGAWAGGPPAPPLARAFLLALLLGLLAGAAVFLVDLYGFHAGAATIAADTGAEGSTRATAAFWTNLAGGLLYGGINEEIMLRLFLVSALVYLGGFVFGRPGAARPALVWTAIILAAVIFGLLHLPITSTMTAITPLIVARAIVLNAIVGLVAGGLYVRYGFEAAALSHAAAHIPIQLGVLLIAP
ncbi:CPBP family glutamic-type intramembrane protease [Acuticoccus kandeliae]|uniref:CPBP family glutamic-type intramembrane protease n=1 Tax=Acuticoccus kandeliae TaxID=2073160 RepID=UPI000D3ED6FC|nr:CPBP family glutamic-type intramembrane protease [Acuticoccus kandeliae]